MHLFAIEEVDLNQVVISEGSIVCDVPELYEGTDLFIFYLLELHFLLLLGDDVVEVPSLVVIIGDEVLALAPSFCQFPARPRKRNKRELFLIRNQHKASLCLSIDQHNIIFIDPRLLIILYLIQYALKLIGSLPIKAIKPIVAVSPSRCQDLQSPASND